MSPVEVEPEPEIDLSSFLERQRLTDLAPSLLDAEAAIPEDDIDKSLSHLRRGAHSQVHSRGKSVLRAEPQGGDSYEEMARDRAKADAAAGERVSSFRCEIILADA